MRNTETNKWTATAEAAVKSANTTQELMERLTVLANSLKETSEREAFVAAFATAVKKFGK